MNTLSILGLYGKLTKKNRTRLMAIVRDKLGTSEKTWHEVNRKRGKN